MGPGRRCPEIVPGGFTGLVVCSNLQFQAEEHRQEDEAEAKEADGQTDQPSEQSSLPGGVVELLAAGYGTAAFHPLQTQHGD